MRYAVTKPMAQVALLASLAPTTTARPTNNTKPLSDNMDFTVMVALLVNLLMNYCTTQPRPGHHQGSAAIQTEYSHLDTLISLRKREKELDASSPKLGMP